MVNSPATSTQWTLVLALTALFLSGVVTLQILSAYAKAYMSAPAEIYTFVDAADSSVEENESYDRDVSRVQRLDDKLRLGRLLREIQKCGDDLREELNGVLMCDSAESDEDDCHGMCDLKDLRLKTTARVLWASKRRGLEDKVRRLDMLRMRFLVVYLGIVSHGTADTKQSRRKTLKDPEKMGRLFNENYPPPPPPPELPRSMTEGVKKKRMPRRLSAALGHSEDIEAGPRQGWAGVMEELQLSPILLKRRASVERSTSSSSSSIA